MLWFHFTSFYARCRVQLLPSVRSHSHLRHQSTRHINGPLALRRNRNFTVLFLTIITPSIFFFLFPHHVDSVVRSVRGVIEGSKLPPSYKRFYELEHNYPQHDRTLPFPEGENGRFLWVSNQHWGLGWNNIFQEVYMTSLIAYLSNRAYVFEPYKWSASPWFGLSVLDGRLFPTQIPLSALIAGPMAGGTFPPGDHSPRAVSKEFFESVCPKERRSYVSIKEINEGLQGKPVDKIVEKYVQVLKDMPTGCVELWGVSEHPLTWQHFNDLSLNAVFPLIASSPLFQHFEWSPLVLAALQTNANRIDPRLSTSISSSRPETMHDMIVLHIRRGDFDEHCLSLAHMGQSFHGWNRVPGLANTFDLPSGASFDEREAHYMKQCFPSIDEIVNRVLEAKRVWESSRNESNSDAQSSTSEEITALRRVYIATNGRRKWVKRLKEALKEKADWDAIVSSWDLHLTNEQSYVSQAIDMAIAQRAAVFIGNGVSVMRLKRLDSLEVEDSRITFGKFSSMTANINLLRRVHGHSLSSSWFW